MAIADDISVAPNGDIRWTGTTATYTVLELHRYLQDLADNASSAGDDLLDITNQTPSDRSTDNIITLLNGYNIDDTVAAQLFDGSIIQAGGDTIYDGLVVLAGAGMYLEIVQNGALITPNFWTNGINADPANGISHRFMVKVRDAGADIDGRRLLCQTREWGFTYSEFRINGTARGNNVAALLYVTDSNNQTLIGTIAGIGDIVNNNEGYSGIDVNNDTTNEFYYSNWDRGANTINTFYERMKWLSRRGSVQTLYGLNGELFRGITHEIDLAGGAPSGTFQEPEQVSWSGGTGQLLAIDDTSAASATKMWIQLLTGVAPTAGQAITGGTSSAVSSNVSGSPTERPVPAAVNLPFVGSSTGTSLSGAYGFGIEAADLTAADTLTDLGNAAVNPPNFVQFSVGGLVSGEDYVLVTPESGGTIDNSQLTANGAQTAGAGTFVVNEVIPLDTPSSGTFRVVRATDGQTDRVEYASYSGSTFTLTGTLPTNVDNGAAAYISYLDKLAGAAVESFTSVYQSDRPLFIRVRDGGGTPIKPFETTGTLGSAGGSTTAIRTSDA